MFSGYQQHDSEEFLQCFLDTIHEDLNRIENKPIVDYPEFDGQEAFIAEVANNFWNLSLSRD